MGKLAVETLMRWRRGETDCPVMKLEELFIGHPASGWCMSRERGVAFVWDWHHGMGLR